jgi:hypothetical protein
LAVLASLAAARTGQLTASVSASAALTGGYRLAFGVGALFAATAGLLAAISLRPRASG